MTIVIYIAVITTIVTVLICMIFLTRALCEYLSTNSMTTIASYERHIEQHIQHTIDDYIVTYTTSYIDDSRTQQLSTMHKINLIHDAVLASLSPSDKAYVRTNIPEFEHMLRLRIIHMMKTIRNTSGNMSDNFNFMPGSEE